jgi:UDP-N-acetylbacillosamine N-acetyltransferase
MKNHRLHIIGAGGHAKMALDIAILAGFRDLSIYDDSVDTFNFYQDIAIKSNIDSFIENCAPNTPVFIGIGDNILRGKLYKKLKEKSCLFPVLKHPSAIINEHANIDEGTVIMPNASINLNVEIGKCGIINTNSIVDHDSSIGDFVHLSPGVNIAGTVSIEEYAWIGIGATVINNVNVGKYSIIGAGSVVTSNIKDGITVVGVPAREVTKDA